MFKLIFEKLKSRQALTAEAFILMFAFLGSVYGGVKLGANVDHSTTSIHGGHTLVVPGDTLGGFMGGSDKSKLDSIGATMKGTADAWSTTNLPSLSGLAVTADGVALNTDGMVVCSAVQTTTTQDGCYNVHSGAWTRTSELASGSVATNGYYVVPTGTANKGVWILKGGVAGTNDLTATNVAGGGGGTGFPLSGNASAAGFQVNNLANGTLASDAINLSQKKLHGALFVSTGLLPTNTYANGTAGVGATITYGSNVACGVIDGHTVLLNETGLVAAEATLANNGLYKATQLGDGSTTGCILTRVDYADDPVELAGLQVEVVDGFTAKTGAPVYILVAPSASITVGTSPIVFMRASISGSPRLAYSWSTDFDSQLATVANGIAVNNSPFTASISGTGAAFAFNNTASGNTDTEIGIATITSGTTAAATASVGNSGAAFNWGTNAAIWIVTKMRVHTALSGATNTFDCHIGTVASAFAAGVWESCDSNADPHWRLNVKSAGTTTIAGTSLIVLDQWDTHLIWKDAGTSQVHWAISGVRQPDPATTNTPVSTPTGPYMSAERTAGTGGVIQLDYTAGQYYYPPGRGL